MSRPSDFNARVEGALRVVLAIAQTIEELRTVPSGHLYAQVMGFMGIETYEALIAVLIDAGKVRQHANHLLEWIGPSGPATGSNQANNQN